MPDCGGLLGEESFPLQTGCASYSSFRACTKCGRVHSFGGNLTFNRPGAAVYFRENGLELVMEPISFDVGKSFLTTEYLYVCLEGQEDEDGFPTMVNLGPNTPLVFDGMGENQMFRFHDECNLHYLLHRGDVNGIEESN